MVSKLLNPILLACGVSIIMLSLKTTLLRVVNKIGDDVNQLFPSKSIIYWTAYAGYCHCRLRKVNNRESLGKFTTLMAIAERNENSPRSHVVVTFIVIIPKVLGIRSNNYIYYLKVGN